MVGGPEALAAAAASATSLMSRSSSSGPLGVVVEGEARSGARTATEVVLVGLFSFPPARCGRAEGALPGTLVVEGASSGVADTSRLVVVEGRGRFWPALVVVVDLGAAGAVFWFFLVGASGWGHSTSWVRSRREAEIHSVVVLVVERS